MPAKPKIRQRPKRIALVNQKGGVGKSLFSLFVGAAAAEEGARVLLRDMDPQANITMSLNMPEGEWTMNDCLKPDDKTGEVVEGSLASAIRPAGAQWPKGLYGVASELSLAARENDKGGAEVPVPSERRLEIVSEGALEGFDLVISDCPPAVGQLTINALVDSEEAIIVTAPELWPIQGAHQAVRTIKRVQRYYHTGLNFGGLYVNRYLPGGPGNEGRNESRIRTQELRESYGELVRDPIVNDIETIRRTIGALHPLSSYGSEAKAAAGLFQGIALDWLNN